MVAWYACWREGLEDAMETVATASGSPMCPVLSPWIVIQWKTDDER